MNTPKNRTNNIIAGLVLIVGLGLLPDTAFSADKPCHTFTFDATASRIAHHHNISYFWDFGDGHTGVEPVTTHTYRRSGTYTVRLSLTDNSELEPSTATASQTVRAHIPPKASFTGENRSCVNAPLTFDASASYAEDGKDLRYLWNFGDGTIAHGERKVIKSYRQGGQYKVILTVDDLSATACSTGRAEKIITVNAPPVAEAGDDVIEQCVTGPEDMIIHFNAAASVDANNDRLGYLWDFGDGNEARGREAVHRYAQAGHYDVRLIVSDNTSLHCGTGVDFVTVKLDRAPKANAGEDIMVCAGETIDFDGSGSLIAKKGTAVARWFFGDGAQRQGLRAPHRYNHPGTYQATLTLESKLNDTCPVSRDTRVVTVNSAPIVNIKSKSSACVGKEVFFDASSAADPDGDELGYYWNFGDGSTSRRGPKASHRYTQGGSYRVSVIVDDRKETSCSVATAKAKIQINTPPIADAGTNTVCCVDKIAGFSAEASVDPDGDRLLYSWNFGDGTTKQGRHASHAYTQSGLYNVSLTVDDQSGSICSKSTDSFTAVVKDSPQPIIGIR